MTTEKVIVLDTMVNLEMIISAETAFVTTIELNMGRMSKKIADIQGKLYDFEERVVKVEEHMKILEEENKSLCPTHSRKKELQAFINEEVETLDEVMVVIYEEMLMLHHTIYYFLTIQTDPKEKTTMLKQVIRVINNIHEWNKKYIGALETIPTKYWITAQNDKADIKVNIQSWDKLRRDVDRSLASYKHLLSVLEYVIEVHRVPPSGKSKK